MEYLEGVDPKKYRSPSTLQKEEQDKKKWKQFQEEQHFSYGWDEFQNNPTETENFVEMIIERSKKGLY